MTTTTRPTLSLTVPYPPSSNVYWRHAGRNTYVSKEAKEYRKEVAKAGEECRISPISGPVAVTYKVYRPRKVGDLMNREKVLSDALNKIAWNDDAQIVEAHLFRFDDKENPRVEVVVEGLVQAEIDTKPARKSAEKAA